tara:strand:- start:172 stop:315 length:144 start_codon:yes stop_codon:yes gene_type:complete
MNKKNIIYISLIVIIVTGFYLSIKQVKESQDERCWEMIKEMAESAEI